MEFFATCPKGFERLLAAELSSLGLDQVRTLGGQVAFAGNLADAYRACLWSRLASRVMLVLGRIDAHDADALYEGVGGIDWTDHLAAGATLAIDAHGTNAQLRNTQFTAMHSKDAIVDQLHARRGIRPSVDTANPDVTVAVRVSRDRATVALDLSGAPLFRRGYDSFRSRRSPIAPLRGDYAAALLAAGGWYRNCRHGNPALLSLFSGAGTLLVEAATEALDMAPGLLRARWGFDGWAGHDADAWRHLVDEADSRAEAAQGRRVDLLAFETRDGARDSALQLLRSAGVHVTPTFLEQKDLKKLPRTKTPPLAVADLSWVDLEDAAQESAALAWVGTAAPTFPGCSSVVTLCHDDVVDARVGGDPSGATGLFIGQDKGTLRVYDPASLVPATDVVSLPDGRAISVFVPSSDQFAARLRKDARLRRKWARKEDVSCYRVYDSDLPDYAVTLDLYHGVEGDGPWLQVSEYAAPKDIDPALARKRLMDVLALAPAVLDVAPEDVFLRVRSHSRGGSQYAGQAAQQPARRPRRDDRQSPALPEGAHLIEEGGLVFEVNFSARLDCGIFLDHRDTRALIREMSKQTRGSKRFLNLFAYTGTATCYAADGGAKHTTTVDMSRPSLEWAERNMRRNGFDGPEHEYVQADVLRWVTEQRHTPNRWDLVFCDVPTFSNSSRMRRSSWDVQRDHAELLIGISRILTANGSCVFSCNLRTFEPDVEYLNRYGVQIEDITVQTIPEDFGRNAKVHHCYLVRRTPRA
jgi:23S rRNA (guanine2445-N2)-methyltransferase / 23S rRNA (guanine2069-N7)-methyltransferase